jgi:hypothetical protein
MNADPIGAACKQDFLPLETTLNCPKSRPDRLEIT